MKPIVKQKLSTLQDIINNAQSGGGGTVDAYTKAEADAKFETITGAAATYLSKSDASRMAHKIAVESTAVTVGSLTSVQFTINNINSSLSDLNGSILIIACLNGLDNVDFMSFIYEDEQINYFLDLSTGAMDINLFMEINNNTAIITKENINASLSGKKYIMTLIY